MFINRVQIEAYGTSEKNLIDSLAIGCSDLAVLLTGSCGTIEIRLLSSCKEMLEISRPSMLQRQHVSEKTE